MAKHRFKHGLLIAWILWFSAANTLAGTAFLDKAGAKDAARALDIAVQGVEVWRLGMFEQAAGGKKSIRFGLYNGSPTSIRWYTQYVELKKAGRVVCTAKTTVKDIAPGQEIIFDVFLVCGSSYDGIDYGYDLKSNVAESKNRP